MSERESEKGKSKDKKSLIQDRTSVLICQEAGKCLMGWSRPTEREIALAPHPLPLPIFFTKKDWN